MNSLPRHFLITKDMNVKLKFEGIWICFVIIFISLSNGTQTDSRSAVIIEEDPLVDKITKVNHNLKLVKLKKVKKVYTNLPEDGEERRELSKKRTLIDLNTKHNVLTQTPIPFLLDVRKDRLNVPPVDLSIDLKTTPHPTENDLKNELIETLPKNQPKSNQISSSDSLANSKQVIKNESHHSNEIEPNSLFHRSKEISKTKPSKILFPSLNKFKNSLNHLSKPSNRLAYNVSSNKLFHTPSVAKFTTTIRPTIKHDFTNRIKLSTIASTTKHNFLNGPTTIRPKTIRPTVSSNKPVKSNTLKLERFKSLTVTTTEVSRTTTYKPIKRTITYTPYVYSPSVTTSAPTLRIRKSYPTTLKQIKTSSRPPSVDEPKVVDGPEKDHNHKLTYQKSDSIAKKIRTNSQNDERPDLESNNSNRKYAKLFFDRDKSKKAEKATTHLTSFSTRMPVTTPLTTTTTLRTTTSYLRTNSRVSTFQSYAPYTRPHTTTNTPQTSYEKTIESTAKNEIDNGKILIAVRKKPVYRPRTTRPIQPTTTTISPSTERTRFSYFQPVTESTNFKLTTTYSPSFKFTTSYPARYRSTTESSLNEEFKTLRYMTTTPTPIVTTTQYNNYKETPFYRDRPNDDYKSSYSKIERPRMINLPADQTTESLKNDLINDLMPRRSKWIMKGTRQRKSETTGGKEFTKSMPRYSEETTIKIITSEYITTTPLSIHLKENSIEKPADYETAERTAKSIQSLYHVRPKPFLIDKMPTTSPRELAPSKFDYEENRRDKSSIDDLSEPEKEIHYQDIKVRKESKLVPQTYFYSTSAPVSVEKLNERLSYLNDEKSKYQKPYERRIHPKTDNSRIPDYEPYENRPKYPNNLAYSPKYQNSRYNHKNRPYTGLDENAREYSTQSYHRSTITTEKPFIRSHFNLGPSSARIHKYGPQADRPVENVQKYQPIAPTRLPQIESNYVTDPSLGTTPNDPRLIVGKLSKAFSNQAPIPYFAPESNDHDIYDRYPEIDLKRIRPIKHQEILPVQGLVRVNSDEGSNEIDKNHQKIKPFDFSNYKPLPNTKFIRTDLESNEIPDKPHKNRPVISIPANEPKYSLDRPKYNRPAENEYSRPEISYPNYYNSPKYNQPVNTQTLTTPSSVGNYPTYFKVDEISNRPSSDRGSARFRLSKIPAKVVYDKYNQKFTGTINLKPKNLVERPYLISKHYADIPEHVRPFEYQKPASSPLVDAKSKYESTTPNNHKNGIPVANDYMRYKNENSIHKTPEYRPVDHKMNYKQQYRQDVQDPEFRLDYRPHQPLYKQVTYRPVYAPIRPQYSNHLSDENNRANNPNHYYKEEKPPNNNSPVRFYSDTPKYHPPYNSQSSTGNINSPPSNSFDNRQHGNQFRPLFNNGHNGHKARYPPQWPQSNNHQDYESNQRNQYTPIHNHQLNNAGHYQVDDKNVQANQRPNTNNVEMINLNDITPNLSLFNGKMPDFKLIHHSVISHDIPIANTYNL